jgi:DNA-directed RNA polymerase specialized sigma subunit
LLDEPGRHFGFVGDVEDCNVTAIAKRLRRPWRTIRRILEALYVLDMVNYVEDDQDDEDEDDDDKKPDHKILRYALAADIDLSVLDAA